MKLPCGQGRRAADGLPQSFIPAAPGIVLMKGRVLVHMSNKQSGQKITNDINYLAVWREEKGKWRFLAWQACKNPPAPNTQN